MSAAGTEQGRFGLRHMPALDGVRGLAVAVVVLYHAGVAQFRGGHLGVTMFFTLSGFLITSLLLVERDNTGRISLRRFWGRRARRLVPALLLCFPLVALVVHLSPQAPGSGLVGDAVAGATWVANWRFVFTHQSYADLFALPSPFQHFWSLAVEEQYYLVFPLVAVLLLRRAGRRAFAFLVVQLIVVSTALAVLLSVHAATISRAYYGTDSRIAEILVGALLALVLTGADGPRVLSAPTRRALDVAAAASLVMLGVLVTSLKYGDLRLFRGGLLLAAVCTAIVIAAIVQPGSVVGRLLAVRPLTALGVVSYGVYLFHWPLFLLLTHDETGLQGWRLLLLRISVTLAVAFMSYTLLERPVRRGWIAPRPALGSWAFGAVGGVAAVALAAGVISLPSLPHGGTVPAAAAPEAGLTLGTSPSATASATATARAARAAAAQRRTTVTGAPSNIVTAPQVTRPSKAATKRRAVPQELVGKPGTDYSKAPPLPSIPAGALKILVVGDSIGNNLGNGLVNWSTGRTDVVVYNLAIPACSVSLGGDRRLDPDHEFPLMGWCSWWNDPSSPRYQAMQKFAPDLVFVEDGVNETFERRFDNWPDWEKPGDPQFDDFVVQQYQSFVDAFRTMKAKVVVANAPCGDWERFFPGITDGPSRIRNLDNLDYPRIVGDQAVDFFSEVCPNGQYSDTVDGVPNARPDGFHFSDEAADALARDWLGPLLVQDSKNRVGGLTGPG